MAEKKRSLFARFFRFLGSLLLIVLLLAAGLIGYLSFTEFKPSDTESIEIQGNAARTLSSGDDLTIASWNIGYGALGEHADFFMDGGSMVQAADSARVLKNMEGILYKIDSMRPDILLIQEADVHSARSRYVNEYASLQAHLEDCEASFANNFKVAFLPYPIPPIGKIDSGIATFSVYSVSDAQRIQLPIPFSWPIRMANLKRCLLVSRIPVQNGKELVLINLHFEAYDDGSGKAAQTGMLSDLINAEIDKGNYVIAGGDFNQTFASADASLYPTQEGNWAAPLMDETQFDDRCVFLMDSSVPSCRSLYKPYADADKDSFQYYLLDGFIVSANVTVRSFAAQDFGFEYADHNPILLQVTLQ